MLQQRQAVHLGHVDVGQHHVDGIVLSQFLQGFDAVLREHELVLARPDATAHPLQDQGFQVRLVVNYQYPISACRITHDSILRGYLLPCGLQGRTRLRPASG